MTYYNINKLEALKDEFAETMNEGANRRLAYVAATAFIDFLKEKENASFFNPNQLEIPFPDEDNSK